MYRQIFIPTEKNNGIPFTIPHEWYGQPIEVIIFPIYTKNISQEDKDTDEDFFKLCGAWESEQSAEDMISEIRSARTFRKRDVTLELR